MGANRAKQKKKAAVAAGFDQNALARLTAKLDTALPKADAAPPTKRKRPQDADENNGAKKHKGGAKVQRTEDGAHEKEEENVLLKEILALGGDEDDYDLVANVDSGDEGGQAPAPKPSSSNHLDSALQEELARFASALGFQQHRPGDEDEEYDEEIDISEDDEEPETTSAPLNKQKTEEAEKPAAVVEVRQTKSSGKLVFEPRADWYSVDTAGVPSATLSGSILPRAAIANLKAFAEELLELDASAYAAQQSSRSTQKFMSTIMKSGTYSDKVSALTLSIQESPVHNRKAFESLIALAGKKSRGQAIAALGALVDLLGNGDLLPSDRRLRTFESQPALLAALLQSGPTVWDQGRPLPGKITKIHLMVWAYEDWLKAAFFRIVQLLEVWCCDEVEYSRSRALDFVFGLLKSKPEQEANLLRLLVNKLGDRDRKIASRASYLILQLLNLHPGMKTVVITAVEHEVLLKPVQSIRAKYYAINTLNQTILSSREPAVADTLLRIYFDIFLTLLKTGQLGSLDSVDQGKQPASNSQRKRKGRGKPEASTKPDQEEETTQKLVSSLLTGVNRAIPFTASDDTTLEQHLDTMFRITHSSNFNTSVQALMLIQQLATSKHLAVDRFYRTLYESLFDPRLVTSSKQALYLNLLYRALKNDVDVRRVKAFVKRLVQILSLHQPSFACGILFLIAELEGTFPDLQALLDVPEENDEEEEVYKDVTGEEALTAAAAAALSEDGKPKVKRIEYDGRKRDPEHSNAHRSCLWELVPFLSHFHPSVSVFAANLLHREKGLPKPDLANHTLMHFLDKFVYRNPKSHEAKRGASIMQPILASGSASHLVVSSKTAARQQVVNSASFWNLKAEDVSAEDTFFHEYFAKIGKPGEASKAKKAAKVEEAGSEDEAAENEIWEALVNSRPEVEGDDATDGSDVDMEDYEDSDGESIGSGVDAEEMSDMGSDGSGGFEGIFDESEDDMPGSGNEEEEKEEVAGGEPVDGDSRTKRMSRKEMRSLPTFASADDYAEMLAAEEDGMAR
ncbi:ribosome biogenesis protein MAK21 [Podospora aff. communis PSN243]|uniref:Ribosome biogenesis protein MAK21 n=1 Tax=Podospora aff. communis PSN243 TaxID=3040156 RepID=A0AAV9GY09_9PEZI|nr:ribosome biogenesis protein MAK21 [Podospora aff. communis PSN243]